MVATGEDIMDECWELIFTKLELDVHLEPLSLVCKRFLSISNQCKYELSINDHLIPFLSKIFTRFKHIRIIKLRLVHGDLNGIIHQIARSKLQLEILDISGMNEIPVKGLRELLSKMKQIKVSIHDPLVSLENSHLATIAITLPKLEELHMGYRKEEPGSINAYFSKECSMDHSRIQLSDRRPPLGFITDTGIECLASKLKNLTKITLPGDNLVTDHSLIALSLNCALLSEVAINCCLVTQRGLGYLLRYSTNLVSLSVTSCFNFKFFSIPSPSNPIPFEDCFVTARKLCVLQFNSIVISDTLLIKISEANLPLKKLTISNCRNFSFQGIYSLLRAYPSLEYLDLKKTDFLTDQCITDLSGFLQYITFINLSHCSNLSDITFSTLTKSCHFLENIQMEKARLGSEDFVVDSFKNPRIKFLNLSLNAFLSSNSLESYSLVCPNLKVLELRHCDKLEGEQIDKILKSCFKIVGLDVSGCMNMKSLGIISELSEMIWFRASGSGIDDKGLDMVADRCRGLLRLHLDNCGGVTTKGVKALVIKCKKLKFISLESCSKVSGDIVSWIVFSRPSLRKIIAPSTFVPTENQLNLFLRHGCSVSCSE